MRHLVIGQPSFAFGMPYRAVIHSAGSFIGPLPFAWASYAQDCDYAGHAVLGANVTEGVAMRNAWGSGVRMTSGFRNPRSQDRVGTAINSAHQTGDACDFNPSRDPRDWPEAVRQLAATSRSPYLVAQGALLATARSLFPAGEYFVDLHGAVPHVHVNRRL